MNDSHQMVKVGIKDESGQVETLWATPVEQNIYRLENSPFFAYGVSWKDVVKAEPDSEGSPFFVNVVKKSGHRTIRVISEKNSKDLPALLSEINNLGCSYEGAYSWLIVIDIPPEVELTKIEEYLITTEFKWEYADPRMSKLRIKKEKAAENKKCPPMSAMDKGGFTPLN